MQIEKVIQDSQLAEYFSINSIPQKVHALYLQQKDTWALAKKNFSDLSTIERKLFNFNGIEIVVQFNPGRIISSSAAVDKKSISERPCFLCSKNLPEEQKGILCNDKYLLLVNPFPIFNAHFTIPKLTHSPQSIADNFQDMLTIARQLAGSYTIFYNGPKCGASAPDHMHFQASPINSMPVEYQFEIIKSTSKSISLNTQTIIYKVENYLRNFFVLETDNLQDAIDYFHKIYVSIADEMNSSDEPLLNIVTSFTDKWRVFIFPRKAHRPQQYFANDDSKILLSPAAVDFGGIFITPRKIDFEKITADDIKDIFYQTSIDEKQFKNISEKLSL